MQKAEETIFYTIESTIKAYRKLAQSTIKKVAPTLTLDQSMLLEKLIENPEATQKELARLLFKDVASITRMIELMVKSGFITRVTNPDNRRQNILTVTPKGKKIIQKASKIVKKNRALALQGISQKDLDKCRKTLVAISQNIKGGE